MTAGAERRLSLRARELRDRGPEALEELPSPEELAGQAEPARHQTLEDLRVELYAISSIVADATVQRARRERPSHPPYGLVRSKHSESRMLVASPEAVEAGSITGFMELGKAYVDTMVFHLDRQFNDRADPQQPWMTRRLEALLSLFRIDAGPLAKSRMRDALSFVYGGLHFGTGVSVQLAQVMARLLEPFPMTAADKADVLNRSIRPAYRLAALNLDHVVFAYQSLQEPSGGPSTWMKADAFVVHESGGRPARIDLVGEDVWRGPQGRPLGEVSTTYQTQGCPARVSPTGGPSPIAALWAWCVELALDTGLLGRGPVGNTGDDPAAPTGPGEGPSGPAPSA